MQVTKEMEMNQTWPLPQGKPHLEKHSRFTWKILLQPKVYMRSAKEVAYVRRPWARSSETSETRESQEDQEGFLEEAEPLGLEVGRENSRDRGSCEKRCWARHVHGVLTLRKACSQSMAYKKEIERQASSSPWICSVLNCLKKWLAPLCPLYACITNG